MRNMTANILLSRAAQYIERNGLTKGQFYDGQPGDGNTHPAVCAIGALIVCKYGREALDDLDLPDSENPKFKNVIVKSAIHKIGEVLGETSFEPHELAWWNNLSRTTKAQVVDTFRAAIKV